MNQWCIDGSSALATGKHLALGAIYLHISHGWAAVCYLIADIQGHFVCFVCLVIVLGQFTWYTSPVDYCILINGDMPPENWSGILLDMDDSISLKSGKIDTTHFALNEIIIQVVWKNVTLFLEKKNKENNLYKIRFIIHARSHIWNPFWQQISLTCFVLVFGSLRLF